MPKQDPRNFPEMPSARHRKERPHFVDIIADEQGVPGKSDVSIGQKNKATRTTRTGEIVRRATFWFADEDIETITRIQRALDLPGVPGVPGKSDVVREAIRRLAAELLATEE